MVLAIRWYARSTSPGRPVDSVRAESESKREERRLGQLNTQVEYLQETNKALENELVGRDLA